LSKPTIYEDYRDNTVLRDKFYGFIQVVFPGVNFIDWHNQGYWSDKYIPISVIEDDKVISNVSISMMKIFIDGEYLNGIQIGAVGTLPEYRNRGLSKFLMDYVLKKYNDFCDIYFLFANDTVLNFYPKFGFNRFREVIFKSSSDIPISNYYARKLDISNPSDLSIIKKIISERRILTKRFGAAEYEFITHWHLLNVFSDNLYFLEDDRVIFICAEKNEQLHIWDVIYTKPINLFKAVSKIVKNEKLQSVNYYFPPDQLSFKYDEVIPDENSYLFVKGEFNLSDRNFKFPITAQT
jgi:GNAT superfamily N-acetyltransferase